MAGGNQDIALAAQSPDEVIAFIEAFAKVNVEVIRRTLGIPIAEAAISESALAPNWDDPDLLAESGLSVADVDQATRLGARFLHIDVAAAAKGTNARTLFLNFTGLSLKLQKSLFPLLSTKGPHPRSELAAEVQRLNAWLSWVRRDGFDPSAFVTYQRGLSLHGMTQNLSGAIGATGAAIAFVHAIQSVDKKAISDTVGDIPPDSVRSPKEVFDWREDGGNTALKSLLLSNGRALVFPTIFGDHSTFLALAMIRFYVKS